jgi:hypothetical protein
MALTAYGVIAALQPSHEFGRVPGQLENKRHEIDPLTDPLSFRYCDLLLVGQTLLKRSVWLGDPPDVTYERYAHAFYTKNVECPGIRLP